MTAHAPQDAPPAIFCIGRNYDAHAREMGAEPTELPTVFMKNPASIIGNGDEIIIPSACNEHGPQVDYEGELAAILGSDLKDASEEEALAAVAAWAPANDVSARWWQREGSGGQWIRGKSFDTFCPIGDHVPAEAVADPQDLMLKTRVNGTTVQEASTGDMIFTVAALLAELSRGTTLLAGSILLGTF